MIRLPENARFIIDRLQHNGYACYAVGGCVRDSLLGKEPNDWDFTTSARPDEIERVFSNCHTIDFGKQFGTIAVILDGEQYEVTAYRTDGEYSDARHPDSVSFTASLRDDLSRRDFTVNAMAYNEEEGLIDLFEGQKDLEYGVIRCVGVPSERFVEDALRILRALRFASVLGFTIEPETSDAILRGRKLLSEIAAERIREELMKLICGDKADFILRRYRSVIAVFIPEMQGTFDFEQQNRHHNRDVYRHSVAAVKNIEPDPILRLTMLFHDIGKPLAQVIDRKGVAHYPHHPNLGAAMTTEILKRLRFPHDEIEEITTLIRWHDIRLHPSPAEIKTALRDLGADRLRKIYKIQRADTLAQSMYLREEKLANLAAVAQMTEQILKDGECYNLRMLAVNGSDLLHMGLNTGEEIGETLRLLLDRVIRDELPNDKAVLVAEAKKINGLK
jgi:tRNA nucleotidyltransferase (CCA-adding enzyme)